MGKIVVVLGGPGRVSIENVTTTDPGLMSAADKVKLDSVPTNGVTSFTRTISQPADGSSFIVALPSAQANANYRVTATLADASIDAIISVPKASRTTTQFLCTTSIDLGDGDSIDFIIGPA